MNQLTNEILQWSLEQGFQQTGITDIELASAESNLKAWLAQQFHGDMAYMQRHGSKRTHPDELLPGTIRVISVRMDYLPAETDLIAALHDPQRAYISRYALGRDYHKLIRKRLEQLAKKIQTHAGNMGYRVFCDSAPVMEKPLAQKAGLGWIGKHTNLINSKAGSWFFLGEIFTDLPLTVDTPVEESHCGSCTACIDVCPTQAIVAPYQLDARRCISYLTIELRGSIPVELRSLMGNRIYGCDDCQLCCPWNKFAKHTDEKEFHPRHRLDRATLLELFAWSEEEFLRRTEGSAIRRIGYACWLRNIAVALGNAPYHETIIAALEARALHKSELVREHVEWAIAQHRC